MNPVLLQAPGSTTHLAEERRMSGGSLISRFSRPATQAFRPNLLPRADPAVTVTTVVHFIYGTTGLVTKHCSRKINVPRIILYGHARHSMTELVNREAAAKIGRASCREGAKIRGGACGLRTQNGYQR